MKMEATAEGQVAPSAMAEPDVVQNGFWLRCENKSFPGLPKEKKKKEEITILRSTSIFQFHLASAEFVRTQHFCNPGQTHVTCTITHSHPHHPKSSDLTSELESSSDFEHSV